MEEFTREIVEFLEEKLNKEIKIKYPWELLQAGLLNGLERNIKGTIETSTVIEGEVYVARGNIIRSGTKLMGPVYICEGQGIGPNGFIRGGTIIGPGCWIGDSEIKTSILLEKDNAGHKSFIGDSIIGRNCNFGAGVKIANYNFEGKEVEVFYKGEKYTTKSNKVGAIIEDNVEIGCNAVINPGSYLSKGCKIHPGVVVHGYVPAGRKVRTNYYQLL